MSDDGGVTIRLDHAEALVLGDFLHRHIDLQDGDQLKPAVKHIGELWALNGLNCLLERELAEPFLPDYGDRVSKALALLVERNGNWPK